MVPYAVTRVVKIYTLIQIGVSFDEIVGYETYSNELITDLRYLLNPLIFILNLFKRDKIKYYEQYYTYVKKTTKQGLPAGIGDSLISLHKEIKEYEEYEMEKQNKSMKKR